RPVRCRFLVLDSRFQPAHHQLLQWITLRSLVRLLTLIMLKYAGFLFLLLSFSIPAFSQTPSTGDYVIGPQDVLAIGLFDQPDLGGKYSVETDGTFSFPLIGRIKAAGLTLR